MRMNIKYGSYIEDISQNDIILVGHYTGYSCMCMQSMNLIWLSMWSGGELTHNTIKEVEIYSN